MISNYMTLLDIFENMNTFQCFIVDVQNYCESWEWRQFKKKKIEFWKIVSFKIYFFSSIITFCKNIWKRFPGLSENLFSVAMTTRVHVTYFDIMFNFSLVALKQWLVLLWMSILNTWKIERCYLQQVCVSWSFSWGFLVLWR